MVRAGIWSVIAALAGLASVFDGRHSPLMRTSSRAREAAACDAAACGGPDLLEGVGRAELRADEQVVPRLVPASGIQHRAVSA